MKILGSRRHHYVARVSIFLTMVALIAGMVGCGGSGGDGDGDSYTLTIDSTAGGIVAVNNVIIPGKTMFIYDPGTVVSLNATPSADYRFVRWIGNVSTIANTTANITTITMNSDYNITAYFEAGFMVAAGGWHTVGLKSDGTVVAVGRSLEWQCYVASWSNITKVAAVASHTVGLKSDGTVLAVGDNDHGQCDVGRLDGHHQGLRRLLSHGGA
jgi:hypothetical protein